MENEIKSVFFFCEFQIWTKRSLNFKQQQMNGKLAFLVLIQYSSINAF